MGKLGGIDFDLVEQKATSILEKKSKDVRALAFLSFALLRKDRWEEIADLFSGMASLADQNFEKLHPERPNAKMMAFKWMSEERYADLLNQKKPAETDYDHIKRLLDSLTSLKAVLDKNFPNGSPFPSGLYGKALLWEKACKPKPQAPAAPAQPTPAAQPSTSSAATAASTTNATAASSVQASALDSPKSAQTNVRTAARFLVEKEPQRIMGYRLMRSVRWDILEKAPPAEGGKTQLPGPNPQQRTYFQNLLGQKDWKTIFDKAEESFVGGSNHLWLDLQRYSAMACKELGPMYEPVRAAILTETGFLLRRIPELAMLLFSDGTPFCDDATKDWIGSEVASSAGKGGTPTAGSALSDEDPVERETKEVNALVGANQIEKALELLQSAARSSGNEEHNFRRAILIGKLLLKAKKPDIAVPVLEALDQKIEQFHLERWNPDLAAEAWMALLLAYRAGGQKPPPLQAVLVEKQAATLAKLCRVDARKAFQLNTQTPQA